MKFYLFIFIFIIFISKNLYSNETSVWLKREIDIILEAYKNQNLSNENRFLLIEKRLMIILLVQVLLNLLQEKLGKSRTKIQRKFTSIISNVI